MRDTISIERVGLLHPKIRQSVKQLIEAAEQKLPRIAIRIVQGLRTFPEQTALYQQGRDGDKRARVTNAKAGQSFHNYGLAIDFAILYDKDNNGTYETLSWDLLKDMDKDGEADWMEVVDIFENAGYKWGGRWSSIKDNPHLEEDFGFTWKQLLYKYNNNEFIPHTNYVLI